MQWTFKTTQSMVQGFLLQYQLNLKAQFMSTEENAIHGERESENEMVLARLNKIVWTTFIP